MTRAALFARDGHRCVYCGEEFPAEALSVDHVQPRMRGGDQSGGNLVTACQGCNTAKGGQPLAGYLAANPLARRNFFRLARYVWPRHLRAVAEALVQAVGQETGLMVMSAEVGGPASAGGILQGDVLLVMGGNPVRYVDELQMRLSASRPGDQLAVRLVRGGSVLDLSVTLGSKPVQ